MQLIITGRSSPNSTFQAHLVILNSRPRHTCRFAKAGTAFNVKLCQKDFGAGRCLKDEPRHASSSRGPTTAEERVIYDRAVAQRRAVDAYDQTRHCGATQPAAPQAKGGAHQPMPQLRDWVPGTTRPAEPSEPPKATHWAERGEAATRRRSRWTRSTEVLGTTFASKRHTQSPVSQSLELSSFRVQLVPTAA